MQTKARLAPWQKTGSGPKHTGGVGTCCCRSAATTSGPSISEERYWKASPKSLKQDCMVCWFTSGSRERGGGEGRNGTEVEKATSLNHWLISPQIVEKTCHKREADYALVFLRESSLIHHHWSLPSVADLIKRVKIPPASDDDVSRVAGHSGGTATSSPTGAILPLRGRCRGSRSSFKTSTREVPSCIKNQISSADCSVWKHTGSAAGGPQHAQWVTGDRDPVIIRMKGSVVAAPAAEIRAVGRSATEWSVGSLQLLKSPNIRSMYTRPLRPHGHRHSISTHHEPSPHGFPSLRPITNHPPSTNCAHRLSPAQQPNRLPWWSL